MVRTTNVFENSDIASQIRYSSPDITSLHSDGYHPVDMHLHTNHSDGFTRIPGLLKYAAKKKIGVAITDHNEIGGSLDAMAQKSGILIIPGIELETLEGPHLLFYFYTSGDLEDFFQIFSRERNKITPGISNNLPVIDCLHLAEPFDCLRVAAHPYGYYGINRGVLKCVEKQMLPGVLHHMNGIEVICGGMIKKLNNRAISYAIRNVIPFTGGSDAHILSDVGNVVTGVRSETVEDFLKGISRRENVVMGKPGSYIAKGATAGVIAWSFVPYTIAKLGTHYSFHKRRTSHFLHSHQCRLPEYFKKRLMKDDESEERRE